MFFNYIFYLSLFPFIVFPLFFLGNTMPNIETVKQTLFFLANAHIAITVYLYVDKKFVTIINNNKKRYIFAPIAIVLLSGFSFAIIPNNYSFLWLAVYFVWQNWHFGRQNYGLYALIAASETPNHKMTSVERFIINFVIAVGALGAIFFVTSENIFWHSYALELRQLCKYFTVISFFLVLGYILFNLKSFNIKKALFLLLTVLFFAPQFLYSSLEVGFNVYSVSHSLQYLFIMSAVAFNVRNGEKTDKTSKLNTQFFSALTFFSIILIGGSILTIRGEFGSILGIMTGSDIVQRFITGSLLGVVVAHFVVDAHAWRLRDTPQKDFAFERLDFAFEKKDQFSKETKET